MTSRLVKGIRKNDLVGLKSCPQPCHALGRHNLKGPLASHGPLLSVSNQIMLIHNEFGNVTIKKKLLIEKLNLVMSYIDL